MAKWADILISVWAIFVVLVYYGGSAGVFGSATDGPVVPWLSLHTDVPLSLVYVVVLVTSVIAALFAFLRTPKAKTDSKL